MTRINYRLDGTRTNGIDISHDMWQYAFNNCPCAGESLETYVILDNHGSEVIGRQFMACNRMLAQLLDVHAPDVNIAMFGYETEINAWLKNVAMQSQYPECELMVDVVLHPMPVCECQCTSALYLRVTRLT